MNIQEDQNNQQAAPVAKLKTPSKMFTDYYGSVFFLLIAVYVAAGFFIIKPKIEVSKQIEAQTQATQLEIENDKVYFENLSRSVAAAQAISPEALDKVELALPSSVDIPEMLVQLNAAASDSGVELLNVNFEGAANRPPPTGQPTAQPVNITVSLKVPDYSILKKFLLNMESNLRIYDVQSLSFSGKDPMTSTLLLRSYYYPAVQKN